MCSNHNEPINLYENNVQFNVTSILIWWVHDFTWIPRVKLTTFYRIPSKATWVPRVCLILSCLSSDGFELQVLSIEIDLGGPRKMWDCAILRYDWDAPIRLFEVDPNSIRCSLAFGVMVQTYLAIPTYHGKQYISNCKVLRTLFSSDIVHMFLVVMFLLLAYS